MYKDEEGEPEPEPPASEMGARADFDVDKVRDLIQSHFKVYEVERDIRGIPKGQIAAYYVQMDPATFNVEFEKLRVEIRQIDPNLLVILQHRLGEDVLLVARKPPVIEKGPALNILLLVLTIITTTMGGALFYQPYAGVENLIRWGGFDLSWLHYTLLFWGFITFSLPLILILGIHELGHFYVARRHHVKTSLPYFIPVPPVVPIGTFGAFISMREPIPDRKALFDIGASGPILGFLVSIPIVVLGMVLTAVYNVQVPPDPAIDATLAGPDDAFAFGERTIGGDELVDGNATFSFGYATHSTSLRSVKDRTHEVERIEFRANNTTLPTGTWRLELHATHQKEEQRVDVTVRYTNSTAPAVGGGDFTAEGNGYVAHVERRVAANGTVVTYVFEVPANVTRVSAEFDWQRPAGQWMVLGDSLLFRGLQWTVDQFLPVADNVFTHPTGIAGWVGLLVTGFNLLPAGQLDGGHVARAVLGDKMKWASYGSVLLMFLLSFQFQGWIVMAILIVFLGLQHPPPLNDKSTLDPKRRWVAFFVLVLLIVTFVPYPLQPV